MAITCYTLCLLTHQFVFEYHSRCSNIERSPVALCSFQLAAYKHLSSCLPSLSILDTLLHLYWNKALMSKSDHDLIYFHYSSLSSFACKRSWLFFCNNSDVLLDDIFMVLWLSFLVISDSLWPQVLQHARLFCPPLYPGNCSNSGPLSPWCHPSISSSVTPFFSCLQSFSESGSFPMSWFFTPGGQDIGSSAAASVLPMNIQDWFPLGWTGWISLQSKGLSRIFSSPIVWKYQFFSAQSSLWSNSYIRTWLLEKP